MKANVCYLIVFGAMAVFPSTNLFAQNDPMAPPASQTQPNQPGRAQAPTVSMRDSSGAPDDTAQEMKDKMFLRKATEDGLAQVELGKLASTKASSSDIKEFGQKVADDHARLNDSIAQVADAIGMRLPKKLNKTDQAQYDRLNGLSGEAFDKEYLACIVKEHHEDLRAFRFESQTTNDSQLKAAVDKAAKVIHEHLVMANKLAEQNGVPLPHRENKPAPPTP